MSNMTFFVKFADGGVEYVYADQWKCDELGHHMFKRDGCTILFATAEHVQYVKRLDGLDDVEPT